jgi:hypothetical protein
MAATDPVAVWNDPADKPPLPKNPAKAAVPALLMTAPEPEAEWNEPAVVTRDTVVAADPSPETLTLPADAPRNKPVVELAAVMKDFDEPKATRPLDDIALMPVGAADHAVSEEDEEAVCTDPPAKPPEDSALAAVGEAVKAVIEVD